MRWVIRRSTVFERWRFFALLFKPLGICRYRITPRQNSRVFRREMLSNLLQTLETDPTHSAHG
jgi:hypothetical protein